MNRLSCIIACLACILIASAQQLTIGSYNIRILVPNDEAQGHVWLTRCQVMCDMINYEAPETFGAQEVVGRQYDDMLTALKGQYKVIGTETDPRKDVGEHSPIFYNPDKVKLLDNGMFWLSETPNVPGKGWDGMYPRVCTWGKFRHRVTGKIFYHFNIHLDHVGTEAQLRSAQLVLQQIKKIAGKHHAVLTGDFNVDQTSDSYSIFVNDGLLVDTYESAKFRFAENGTFNNFDTTGYTTSRIDHIMVTRNIEAERYAILTNSYWSEDKDGNKTRRNPSDHYPVFVKLLLK